MKALEAAHKAETRELLNKWNSVIIPNFENEVALIEIELKKRHQNELDMFREAVEREQSEQIVHYSGEILNLRKKSEVLGTQGYYKEAKTLKKKVKELISAEKEKHDNSSKEKFVNRSQLLLQKQTKEMLGLKKKHASQREELDQQRRREFEIIERRFINVWTEMETKFRKEGQKLDRDSTVKKMQLRDAAKKTIALR